MNMQITMYTCNGGTIEGLITIIVSVCVKESVWESVCSEGVKRRVCVGIYVCVACGKCIVW